MNDGGPAFPYEYSEKWGGDAQDGMSIRDYFAAHATEEDVRAHMYDDRLHQVCSREAARYRYADAMLKAREQ
jgi:hypothetical protein